MNLYFGLFCTTGVLFINSSELGFNFLGVCTIMFDKETWRKDCWFLFFMCSLVWLLYTEKCEFSSKLRFYIKDWSPSRGSGATVGLIFPEIFVSPLSEFEQHMYSSDPRTDTGSLMQLESRGAVPQASQPPIIQSLSQDILIIPRQPRSEKPLQTSGSRTFLSFSCFSIAKQVAVSRSAALLLRIKALALQKRPLFVLFALAGRTAAILDVAMLCTVEGAQCKTRELP